MRFHTRLVQSGKTATGLQVPPEVVERLGSGKRPAVSVTLRGHTYRSTIASMRGVYMLPVSAEIRGITGLAGGDPVDVEVELDTAPREVTLPADFAASLDAEQEARSFFQSLSYSNKQRIVLAIEQARTAETRQRRIAQSVQALREERI
jgi:Bacteriocin-protection, YdeI or OmpD-Associated/Domain of unknown function (DUF1905)